MYDSDLRNLYKFRSFGDFHGVGFFMAYTKKYALDNKFDDTVGHAEEKLFTNSFALRQYS